MGLKTSEAVGGREVDGRGDEDECRGQSDGPAKDDELRPGCGDVRVELAGGFEPLLRQVNRPGIARSRPEGDGLPPDRRQPLRFERYDAAKPPNRQAAEGRIAGRGHRLIPPRRMSRSNHIAP